MTDKCEFYPTDPDDPVCACNSDISGTFACTKQYSLTCQWANERRDFEARWREIDKLVSDLLYGRKEKKDGT